MWGVPAAAAHPASAPAASLATSALNTLRAPPQAAPEALQRMLSSAPHAEERWEGLAAAAVLWVPSRMACPAGATRSHSQALAPVGGQAWAPAASAAARSEEHTWGPPEPATHQMPAPTVSLTTTAQSCLGAWLQMRILALPCEESLAAIAGESTQGPPEPAPHPARAPTASLVTTAQSCLGAWLQVLILALPREGNSTAPGEDHTWGPQEAATHPMPARVVSLATTAQKCLGTSLQVRSLALLREESLAAPAEERTRGRSAVAARGALPQVRSFVAAPRSCWRAPSLA